MKKWYCSLVILCVLVMFCPNTYATTIILQPGAEGKDSKIRDNSPNANFGADDTLGTGGASNYVNIVTLIEFDLADLYGVNESINITSAKLSLNRLGGIFEVFAQKITSSWTEGTGTYENPVYDNGVDWYNRPTMEGELVGMDGVVGGGATSGGWSEWDITAFVQDWYDDPLSNYGVSLYGARAWSWASSDYVDSSLHPKLEITYDVVPVPEPTSMLLLGLGVVGLVRRRIRK